jgi:hypothetical protein
MCVGVVVLIQYNEWQTVECFEYFFPCSIIVVYVVAYIAENAVKGKYCSTFKEKTITYGR